MCGVTPCFGSKKKAVNTKSTPPSVSKTFQPFITVSDGQKFKVTGKKKTKR